MSALTYIVYPIGGSNPVVEFNRLVDMLDADQLTYLNSLIAVRMMGGALTTGEQNEPDTTEKDC